MIEVFDKPVGRVGPITNFVQDLISTIENIAIVHGVKTRRMVCSYAFLNTRLQDVTDFCPGGFLGRLRRCFLVGHDGGRRYSGDSQCGVGPRKKEDGTDFNIERVAAAL